MAYKTPKPFIIMADDDEDDRYMMKEALTKAGVTLPVMCVEDGKSLLSLLHEQSTCESPHPAFILLDLNMPRMDGRKSLELIRQDELLKKIPVIIFTTSDSEDDIALAYEFGANSFILKPSSFSSMIDIMKTIKSYWLETVALPD